MDDSPSNLPARIDRAAVDRMLARALELQADVLSDPQGQLTEAQLLELAKEVGLDPVNLRQALAEERTRVARARGAGAARVALRRRVRQRAAHGERHAQRRCSRRSTTGCSGRNASRAALLQLRAHRVGGAARRAWRHGAAHGEWTRATRSRAPPTSSATAIALDATRVLVRLDARLAGYRSLMAQQNVALTGVGVVAGGVLAVLSFPLLAAAAPVALLAPAAFAAGRASHQRTVGRAQLALEQVLDRLERGEAGRPPTLLSMLAAAVAAKALAAPHAAPATRCPT